MIDRTLTLGYSPCPNDTYIFGAWTNTLLEGAPPVRAALEDVENLNGSALKGNYDLTKVSYGAVPQLMEQYRILRAGGALGRGCGPLLVARPESNLSLEELKEKIVAIPGEMTTAFMLLRLAMRGRPQTIAMRFDTIVEAVHGGSADAGLIIHESRFTYEDQGLVKIIDLGEWWESQTGMPIPLGAILARNDVDDSQAALINETIRRSLCYARERTGEVMPFVRAHSSEMSEDVMLKHIATYVNEYTDDVGDEGVAAVQELFRRAHEAQIMPEPAEITFV